MATVEPFRGLRYDPTMVPDLAAVTAPPYDVIGPELQARLLAEPHNIAHLDFNRGSTDLNDPDNRYRQAAQQLGRWRDLGVLRRDLTPSFYLYEQEYEWAGARYTRSSFIARVKLEPFGAGCIHPHERTFAGPKEDRFHLTCETRCNLSQVLAVYDDPTGTVASCFAAVRDQTARQELSAWDGVVNRLWRVSDPDVCAAVTAALADRDLYIADGHHRYETALRYLAREQKRAALPDDHPASFTSMVLTGSHDPGLRIMPTHRVLNHLDGFGLPQLIEAAAPWFTWEPLAVAPDDAAALEQLTWELPTEVIGLLDRAQVGLLRPTPALATHPALADLPEELARLNVTALHQVLLPEVIEPRDGQPTISYVHLASEAVDGVRRGADLAVLLRACPLETVISVAGSGHVMPQKSTYFYPKVLTGLVLYPLRD